MHDAQLQAYRRMPAVDFLYALAYAGFLVLSIRFFAWEKMRRFRLYYTGAIAAAAAAFFDYVENTLVLVIIDSMS